MAKLSSDMCPSILTKTTLEHLCRRKIFTVIDVLREDPAKLKSITKLEFKDVMKLRETLVARYSPFPRQGLEAFKDQKLNCALIPSGIPKLDNLLGGGFLTGNIFEICGFSGSGKTQLCLTASCNIALQMKTNVHFIDTKLDFSGSRVHSILEAIESNEELVGSAMEKILVTRVHNFSELYSFLYHLKDKLVKEPRSVRIIFIESLPAIFLQYMGNHKMDSLGLMNCLASLLKYISNEHHVSIVLVNLASMWIEEESAPLPVGDDEDETIRPVPLIDLKPVLGKYWAHVPSTRLYIEQCGPNIERKITVMKSTHLPVGRHCSVSIFPDGVR